MINEEYDTPKDNIYDFNEFDTLNLINNNL